MTDFEIVELYWQRNEAAIEQTKSAYGNLIRSIAYRVLMNTEDCEEVENDTYLSAWNSMPDNRPATLSTYLSRIARQNAIDIYRKKHSAKRAATAYSVPLEELGDIASDCDDGINEVVKKDLEDSINRFLKTLDVKSRNIFIGRYFYFDSVKKIAEFCDVKESTVKTILFRTRQKLKYQLESEGYTL